MIGFTELTEKVRRLVRFSIRLSRRVNTHQDRVDKIDYQMSLVSAILERQNVEIEELRARIAQSAEHSPCKRDVAGSIPAPGSTELTAWGTLVG